MDDVLRGLLRNNQYFEEINQDRFVPAYLGLIVNGVVIYHVNWKDIKTHPIASLFLKNLNSLMIITNDGIKEVL